MFVNSGAVSLWFVKPNEPPVLWRGNLIDPTREQGIYQGNTLVDTPRWTATLITNDVTSIHELVHFLPGQSVVIQTPIGLRNIWDKDRTIAIMRNCQPLGATLADIITLRTEDSDYLTASLKVSFDFYWWDQHVKDFLDMILTGY